MTANFFYKFLKVDNFLRNYLQKQPPEVFCKKGVPKNFENLTGKHLFWIVLTCKLFKSLQHRYFPVKFAKRLRKPILNPFWRTSVNDCFCM